MNLFSRIILLILLFGQLIFSTSKAEQKNEILVISNIQLEGEINRKQLKQIYLEGGINFPVKPINMKSGVRSRAIFNAKIIGLTESRIKAYWAQMKFTGRASPPKELASAAEVILFLEKNSGYIAYVPAETKIPESLHIIYSF